MIRFTLLIVLFAMPVFANPASEKLLAQADAAYAQRTDLAKAQDALTAYGEGLREDPKDPVACWKAARAAWWVADHSEKKADKLVYFQKGIDYAKQGLANRSDCIECHFWLGANYGSFGESKGVMKSLSLVKPIRQEMAKVNRLNDHFMGGAGYRVLGTVDYKVPAIAGGSKKRALEELMKAFTIDPQDPFTLYYLAEYYKTVGNKTQMNENWNAFQSLGNNVEFGDRLRENNRPEWDMLLEKGKLQFEK
jgi:tetratricopeptide (TPR) repeat protein